MNITKCDKCGKQLKYKEGYTLHTEERHIASYHPNIDLCDKCMKKIKKWVENKKQIIGELDE